MDMTPTPDKFIDATEAKYLPDEVLAANDLVLAARHHLATEEPDLTVTLNGATAKTVTATLDAAVDAMARRSARVAIAGDAYRILNRHCVGVIVAASTTIIETQAKDFDPAAKKLAELVKKLPAGYSDPAVLVKAGPDALATFQAAKALTEPMEAIRASRDALAKIGVQVPHGGDAATRYATFTSMAALEQGKEAIRQAGEHSLGLFGALLAIPGTTLKLQTVAEQREHIASLDSMERQAQAQAHAARMAEAQRRQPLFDQAAAYDQLLADARTKAAS